LQTKDFDFGVLVVGEPEIAFRGRAFRGHRPPRSHDFSKSTSNKAKVMLSRLPRLRKLKIAALLGSAAFGYDYVVNEQAFFRNFRTVGAAIATVIDYKIFFDEENVSELHSKVAARLLHVCKSNGGLYIKFGQGM
jgi:hypothetical protein